MFDDGIPFFRTRQARKMSHRIIRGPHFFLTTVLSFLFRFLFLLLVKKFYQQDCQDRITRSFPGQEGTKAAGSIVSDFGHIYPFHFSLFAECLRWDGKKLWLP